MKLIIITPVRNEEKYIDSCIQCMLRQTYLPKKWIIVNDGSDDDTEKIVLEYADKHDFMKYIKIPDRGYRYPGRGVVDAFYVGYETLDKEEFDIIAKFDGDLSFPEHMMEKIVDAFKKDPVLGITGGVRYDAVRENEFKKVIVPKYYVGGPTKFYRKECFVSIRGLIKRAGWDGADVIRAQKEKWKTGEIPDLFIYHLRPTGTSRGEGLAKASLKYGDVSYYLGGYPWYFVLRVLGRSFDNKSPKMLYYMIKGYLSSKYNKLPREEDVYRDYFKLIQMDNVKGYVNLLFNKNVFKTKHVHLLERFPK
jgi:poly-beta-1,6-N-acetyl-D-glucosamine synthase